MDAVARVPQEIQILIAEGVWPRDHALAQRQNLAPLISDAAVRAFAPEESMIFLYPPPFVTVRTAMKYEADFWRDLNTALTEIDPDLTVLIGDFGMGSDAPLALDYRVNPTSPKVIRLRCLPEGNHWVDVATDLAKFVAHFKPASRE